MKRIVISAAAAATVIACSSSDSSSACPIAGTYADVESVDTSAANTCGATSDTTPSTVTVAADGQVVFQGITGSCPGTISGCTLTAACQASAVGGGPATIQISWTFDSRGFHGSSALGAQPTGKPKCETTFLDSATRK